jgi:hypothetical protein
VPAAYLAPINLIEIGFGRIDGMNAFPPEGVPAAEFKPSRCA